MAMSSGIAFLNGEKMEILIAVISSITTGGVLSFVQFLITRNDNKKGQKYTACLEMQKKHEEAFKELEQKTENVTNICIGLAYDRIIHVGEKYLKQGFITVDQREDFRKYLWQPYHNAGGNGSGDAMMKALDDLPIEKGE